jgi:ATP-dependent DNA helicase RecG
MLVGSTKNNIGITQYDPDLILRNLVIIEKAIREHGNMERKDANDLLQNKIPEWIDDKQRKIKINNLLSELRRKNSIQNNGSDSEPK